MGFFSLFKKKHMNTQSKQLEESRTIAPPEPPPETSNVSNCFRSDSRNFESDENLSLKDAKLSYLDAKALKYWNGKPTDFRIPSYYSESSFGRNVGPALRRLLDGGFLSTGDIRRNIKRKTVLELKAILAEKELKVSGKKDELIQRLLDHLSSDELYTLFPVGVYEITPAGNQALSEYSIIFENEDWRLGLSYYRLLKAKSQYPSDSDEAIITRLFNEDIQECYRTGDKATYQQILPGFAMFANGHGEPDVALELCILSYFVWTKDAEEFSFSSTGAQNYYLAKDIERYGKLCDFSLEQVVEFFRSTIQKNNPFGLSSKENVERAITMFRSGLGIK